METEYQEKKQIIDLYAILGLTKDVCKEATADAIIKLAYEKKAKACHPDKRPGDQTAAELFELISGAYDILKNAAGREQYNNKISLQKQSAADFLNLKKKASEYAESLGPCKDATDDQKLLFKQHMALLDKKHGYDASNDGPMSANDAKKRLNDLAKERAIQDVTLKPEKLFSDGRFDPKKFNAAFDQIHNRGEESIMPYNGAPTAFGGSDTSGFSSFDDLNNLYVDDNSRIDLARQNFGSTQFNMPTKKITAKDLENIAGADYYDNHDVLGDDYYADMKKRISARKSEADSIEKMRFTDFKRDDFAGYGIHDQLGMNDTNHLALTGDDDDISTRYERLMAERNKDILPVNPPPAQINRPVPSKLNNNKMR